MVNITRKYSSHRKAIAVGVLQVSKQETIDAIRQKKVPKGDVFEFSRAAGLLAIKKTSDVIPDCHPLPVEFAAITHSIEGLRIMIAVEVHTIYKTGVEVEAMHGAAVVALTMYDMLKPIDAELEIAGIKLQKKQGGKSGFQYLLKTELKCAVVVCSDSVFAGSKTDTAGKTIVQKLESYEVNVAEYVIVPDELVAIRNKAVALSESGFDLVIFTGGTGLSPTDVTPEALLPLIVKPVPGIIETVRNFGQERTPYAMLSRGVSGFIGQTLVVALPGSAAGAEEGMDAIFPAILHIFAVRDGKKHEL